MQAELKVLDGKQQGKSIPLNMKKFLIGREEDCHLRANSDLISRHHCVFSIDDYTVRLRDLGSTNGTFVNEERISGQVVLSDGDRVQIGKLLFQVVVKQGVPAVKGAPAEDS
ncbi:MAG: FHA domain-containing protein, partial [Planctomycetales bacterium]|nr:FHA domain-containing protein [Planctomycetales bacterium]